MNRLLALIRIALLCGCTTVPVGHRGLYFDPGSGLKREPLPPGRHWTGLTGHVEDFDITFSTRTEEIHTTSAEGLALDLSIALIFRPVDSELYELLTQIGTNYYDEVVGPEFKSAARGVFARHSYLELLKKNEQIEDEIEADLRRRIVGKHVEVASVTLESLKYAPAIARAVEEKLAAEQDAARQKTVIENDAMRRRLELENQAEQARIKAETAFKEKQRETELAKAQAALEKLREQSEAEKGVIRAKAEADQGVIRAKAEAEEAKLVARAKAEQAKALNATLTPLAVMAKGYDALKSLGGSNTHILIGDWSKVPNFLFPPMTGARARSPAAELEPVSDPKANP